MVNYLVPKDKKYRYIFVKKELSRLRFKFFSNQRSFKVRDRIRLLNFFTHNLNSSLIVGVKARNRCLLSGRAGSINRHFKLSRIRLKSFASNGLLPGVRRAS